MSRDYIFQRFASFSESEVIRQQFQAIKWHYSVFGFDRENYDVDATDFNYSELMEEDMTPESSSAMPTPSPWQSTYEQLFAARSLLNSTTKVKQNKQFYSNEGADLLLESVAKVLNMRSKPEGMKPKDWANINPSEVLIVDARRIVFHIYKTLINAPQAAVRGRLIAMLRFAPEVQFVGLFRRKTHRANFQDIAEKFEVVLYRSDTPMIKPREMHTEEEEETN